MSVRAGLSVLVAALVMSSATGVAHGAEADSAPRLATVSFPPAATKGKIVLVEDGRAAPIVVAKDASETVLHAARELQKYLKKITGVEPSRFRAPRHLPPARSG